jgi:hypothetical protein
MNDAILSAFAVLAGSAIGALTSIETTRRSLNAQERAHRLAQSMSRKEKLYGEFIEEASKLLPDALTNKLDDVSKLVDLYALVSKLRLFAPATVLASADEVTRRIIEIYESPGKDFHAAIRDTIRGPHAGDIDLLRTFSESCRRDMDL